MVWADKGHAIIFQLRVGSLKLSFQRRQVSMTPEGLLREVLELGIVERNEAEII